MPKRLLPYLAALPAAFLGAWLRPPIVHAPTQPPASVAAQTAGQSGDAQDEDAPQEPPKDATLYGRVAGRDAALLEKMQGAWQLLNIDDPNLETDGRSHHGFLLVSGEFLAIEVHVAWDDEDGYPLEDAFQTGIHEFRIDQVGRLLTVSLIGSFLDDEEELDWEEPGTPRDFGLRVSENFLTLTREDGSSLDFGRRLPGTGRTRDIFGRVRQAAGTKRTDVFGRESKVKATKDENEGGR